MIALQRHRPLFQLMLCVVSVALAQALVVAQADAAGYKKCGLTQREQQPGGTKPKPTYNLLLKQQSTTCATARKVMKAFHACRSLTSYRCADKVLGRWSCTARKTSSTAGVFYATYTCAWGKRRVQGTYQQNVPST